MKHNFHVRQDTIYNNLQDTICLEVMMHAIVTHDSCKQKSSYLNRPLDIR